jgi:ATP-dependent DNA helicase RecQ
MKAERPVRLLLPPVQEAARAANGKSGRRSRPPRGEAMPPAASSLFESLRAHRLALAREQGVPPFVIASDRTLREMAVQQPRTRGDLMDVYGIGVAKADRYGKGFLDVIARAAPTLSPR